MSRRQFQGLVATLLLLLTLYLASCAPRQPPQGPEPPAEQTLVDELLDIGWRGLKRIFWEALEAVLDEGRTRWGGSEAEAGESEDGGESAVYLRRRIEL